MNRQSVRPRSLFKYVGFGSRILDSLWRREVYFANPIDFNDPLDCRPAVIVNTPHHDLERLARDMIIGDSGFKNLARFEQEIAGIVNSVDIRQDIVGGRRAKLLEDAARKIDELTNTLFPNRDIQKTDKQHFAALVHVFERAVLQATKTGILCLSEKFDSPLMWSHYGDQHRGLCLEYDTSGLGPSDDAHRVQYGASREIYTSEIHKWIIEGDTRSAEKVKRACLLTKSDEWKYEEEWRLFGSLGSAKTKLRLKSITFDMRCPPSIRYTVMKTFKELYVVNFWEICEPTADFRLRRKKFEDGPSSVSTPNG